jgi:sodium transport system permease protein
MNKNNILITIKKELRSIFRDKKTICYIFGFPFIIAFLIFLMGYMEDSIMNENNDIKYSIGINYEVNEIEKTLMEENSLIYEKYDSLSDMKEAYYNGEIEAYLDYDKDNKIYYIYTDESMMNSAVSTYVMYYLDSYNSYIGNAYLASQNINVEEVFNNFTYELKNTDGDEVSESEMIIELVMNMAFTYIIMVISLATVNMATTAIATEKENGTLETILTLPITIKELILGKYLATFIIGFIASLVGFIITLGSFGIATNMFSVYEEFSMGFSVILFGVVICLVAALLIAALAILLTSSAKTYKESQASGSILQTICVLPLFLSMVSFDAPRLLYIVPILSHTNILMELYSGTCNYVNLLLTIGSTLVYVCLILYVLVKKFKSEKVLFG